MSAGSYLQPLTINFINPNSISNPIFSPTMDKDTDLGIFAKIISYLSLSEFYLLNGVSSAWYQALHTRICVLQNIQIRGRLSSEEFARVPDLTIGDEIFQNQDPTGEVLDAYFFMQLSRLPKEEKLVYLQNLSERQRERIQTLEVGKGASRDEEITDDDVISFLELCPNVISLTVISSSITGSFLQRVSSQAAKLKLVGAHLQVEYLESIVKRCTNLTDLEVVSKNLSSRYLQALSDPSSLERLTLVSEHLQDDHIGEALARCTSLTFLKVESSAITGSFLEHISDKITALNLKGNHLESNYLVAPLQKQLKKLNFSSNICKTDFLQWVIENRSLESLIIYGMNVQNESKEFLKQIHERVQRIQFCNLKRRFIKP